MSTRRIIIDTREQRPYDFENAIRGTLQSGDYSIEGYESQIAIERKSLEDFVNTILADKKSGRFTRELERLQSYRFAAVVIEATWDDIKNHKYNSRMHPNSVIRILLTMKEHFAPVLFLMGIDRPFARKKTEQLLRAAEIELDRDREQL